MLTPQASSLHLFAFLGTGHYKPCLYAFPDTPCYRGAPHSPPVTFIQAALASALKDELGAFTVFVTPRALATHGEGLREECERLQAPVPHYISIPDITAQDSLHTLFDVLRDPLLHGPHRLVFDLTHGFRALPALGLLILNYLKALNQDLTVESIVYGAFEQRDPDDPHSAAPIIDLIQLWELNAWSSAFDMFRTTGDPIRLIELSHRSHDTFYKAGLARTVPRDQQSRLKNFAASLQKWSDHKDADAVPHLFGKEQLIAQLRDQAQQEWNPLTQELGRFVQPLKEELAQTLQPMCCEAPDTFEGLDAQLHWVRWLARKRRHGSALTILREWTSTLVQLIAPGTLGVTLSRERADYLSGGLQRDPKLFHEDPQLAALAAVLGDELCGVFSTLSKKRNLVNHAFIPYDAQPAPGLGDLHKDILSAIDVYQHTLDSLRERLEP